jgi:tetratricopeptide (TPR) repeat protein
VNATAASQFEADIDTALSRLDLDRAEGLAARYEAAAGTVDSVGMDLARAPWFRARYLAAQVALAAGRLGRAADLLAPVLSRTSELPTTLACRVWLLAAEAWARARQFAAAGEALTRAEAANPALRREPLLAFRRLRVLLWLAAADGSVATLAEEVAAFAQSLAETGDRANLALLFCEEGRAWDAHGDLDRAEACWHKAAQHHPAEPHTVDPIRADVLTQLGRLDHLRGRLQPALDRYEEGLAHAGAGTPQSQEIQLRRLLVLLDLNQWQHVRTVLADLVPDADVEQLPEEVRGLAAMVKALTAVDGDGAAARAFHQEALRETTTPVREACRALALGLSALAAGDRGEANAWLRRAEDLARKLDLPEVLWRALQARGQLAAEWDGNATLARQLFEEAVLVSEAQARQLRHRTDASAYQLHRSGVLRLLLQSACRRGEAEAVFRYQELERGRLLLDLWREAPSRRRLKPGLQQEEELAELDRQVEDCERALQDLPEPAESILRQRGELLLRRDRLLDEFLRDRSRRSDAALPALPDLAELERALPPDTVYVAPSLLDEDLYVLVARRAGSAVIPCRASSGTAATVRGQVEVLRHCLAGQLERYRRGLPLGACERKELDAHLEDLGRGPLGVGLDRALDAGGRGPKRLVWVADGELHGLPVHALRRRGRYLVEEHEVVHTFSGSLFVHQKLRWSTGFSRLKPGLQRAWPLGRALVVTAGREVLPTAAREGEGVAATFCQSRILHGAAGTKTAARRGLANAPAVHFACHAYFDVEHPLAAGIGLPSGEIWRALEWLDEPADGLPLVTLSACRSAEVAPLVGREVFGLVTGLLGSGVRAVLAGLWPVADRETLPLMWRFYRNRLTADLATALAQAQRETLADSSPLFWAAFALFGDAAALPRPWWRWWGRWRQRRHAYRFPIPENPVESSHEPR